MLEFRSIAFLFGFDTHEMSDQEIKDGVQRASVEMSKAAVSASEAGEALRNMVIQSNNLKLITHPCKNHPQQTSNEL